jgi:hypothetical protein
LQSLPNELLKAFIDVGDAPSSRPNLQYALAISRYIQTQCTTPVTELFIPLFFPGYRKDQEFHERLVGLICSTGTLIRQEPATSIVDIVASLVQDEVLDARCLDTLERDVSIALFYVIGWLTMVYKPDTQSSKNNFSIETYGSKCFRTTALPITQARRPLNELVNAFGRVLPSSPGDEGHDSLYRLQPVQSAMISVYVLTHIGGLSLRWVDNIGSHLELNEKTNELLLFRLPSYCKLLQTENTPLAL